MTLGKWIGLVVFSVSLYIIWQIRDVILLLLAAIVFAIALNQMVKLLQQLRLKRGIAIALAFISLIAVIVGFLAIIFPPLIDQFQQLLNLIPNSLERLQIWLEELQNLSPIKLFNFDDTDYLLQPLNQNIRQISPQLFRNFLGFFSSGINSILNILLVLVLSIMLLANPPLYRQGFLLLFPAFYRPRINGVLLECEESLISWMKGTLINMTVIGIVTGIGLWILQVPLVLTNAFIAGLLEFIPNLGPTLSVIPPVLIALLDQPWKAIAVIILYVCIQQLESNILVPIVMQRAVSLAPVVTILSVVIFSIFFGILGLLLSLPLAIIIQIVIKELLVKDILDKWGVTPTNNQPHSLSNFNSNSNS